MRAAAATYRSAMHDFAAMGSMEIWYSRLDARELLTRWGALVEPEQIRALKRTAARAHVRGSRQAMTRLTEDVGRQRRFVNRPPLVVRLAERIGGQDADTALHDAGMLIGSSRSTLSEDRQVLLSRFRVVDVARKVVGVGSVGTRDWVLLLLGRDDDDPLLLQFKEAEPSILERYLGSSVHDNHGQRVWSKVNV